MVDAKTVENSKKVVKHFMKTKLCLPQGFLLDGPFGHNALEKGTMLEATSLFGHIPV